MVRGALVAVLNCTEWWRFLSYRTVGCSYRTVGCSYKTVASGASVWL